MVPHQVLCRTVGIFMLLSVPFTACKRVDELMTDDEILHIFRTTRDKVPEYVTVTIQHSLHKRSTSQDTRIEFEAFGTNFNAHLQANDGILVGEETPVWTAQTSGNKTHYRKLKQGIMKDAIRAYQGVNDQAAFVVKSRDRRDVRFHGTIQDLTVVPLPDRVQQKLEKSYKEKRNLYNVNRTMALTRYHIAFKSNTRVNQTGAAQQLDKSRVNKEDFLKRIDASRSRRSSKYMVFPTILVTTDFDVAVESEDDIAYHDQIIYQVAFWNGVDLRFRHLSNPKVRLRIAGIVIGSDRSATTYFKRNMHDGKLEAVSALDDMQTYWSMDVISMATISSICRGEKNIFWPSLIVKDDLGFGGINTAVHELGHILGARHDDDDGECPSSDGYLMSITTSSTANNLKWSNCSLEDIKTSLSWRSCIDKPKEHHPLGKPAGRVLPGTLKTTEEQCQARGFHRACETTPDICRVLKCYNMGFHGLRTLFRCQDSMSAAEGTECAPGSICIGGECLPIHEEIMQTNEIHSLLVLIKKALLGSYDSL